MSRDNVMDTPNQHLRTSSREGDAEPVMLPAPVDERALRAEKVQKICDRDVSDVASVDVKRLDAESKTLMLRAPWMKSVLEEHRAAIIRLSDLDVILGERSKTISQRRNVRVMSDVTELLKDAVKMRQAGVDKQEIKDVLRKVVHYTRSVFDETERNISDLNKMRVEVNTAYAETFFGEEDADDDVAFDDGPVSGKRFMSHEILEKFFEKMKTRDHKEKFLSRYVANTLNHGGVPRGLHPDDLSNERLMYDWMDDELEKPFVTLFQGTFIGFIEGHQQNEAKEMLASSQLQEITGEVLIKKGEWLKTYEVNNFGGLFVRLLTSTKEEGSKIQGRFYASKINEKDAQLISKTSQRTGVFAFKGSVLDRCIRKNETEGSLTIFSDDIALTIDYKSILNGAFKKIEKRWFESPISGSGPNTKMKIMAGDRFVGEIVLEGRIRNLIRDKAVLKMLNADILGQNLSKGKIFIDHASLTHDQPTEGMKSIKQFTKDFIDYYLSVKVPKPKIDGFNKRCNKIYSIVDKIEQDIQKDFGESFTGQMIKKEESLMTFSKKNKNQAEIDFDMEF